MKSVFDKRLKRNCTSDLQKNANCFKCLQSWNICKAHTDVIFDFIHLSGLSVNLWKTHTKWTFITSFGANNKRENTHYILLTGCQWNMLSYMVASLTKRYSCYFTVWVDLPHEYCKRPGITWTTVFTFEYRFWCKPWETAASLQMIV